MIYLAIYLSVACNTPQPEIEDYDFFKNEMNNAVIDGFYDNDTTGIGNTIYLLK